MQPRSFRLVMFGSVTLGVSLVVLMTMGDAAAWEPKNKAVAQGKEPLELLSSTLTESSGLAFSLVDPDCFWSHNDSGGKARLLAFGPTGKPCGRIIMRGVKANDWEDMASYVEGVPRLLVADVGDNDSRRKAVSIYLFDEPSPKQRTDIESYTHLKIRYSGGPQNCEAVAVDSRNQRILLLGKSPLGARLFEVELPRRAEEKETQGGILKVDKVATLIRTLPIPLATGMDLCGKTGDLWISNYLTAFRYAHQRKTTIEDRFKAVPEMFDLPKLKQIEAIASDEAGNVWVTTEGKPAKIQRLVF